MKARNTYKMVELTDRHVATDILTHAHERNTNHRQRLMQIILDSRVEMIVAVRQQRLNLQHIAGAGE